MKPTEPSQITTGSSVSPDHAPSTVSAALVTLPRSQKISSSHLHKLAIVYVRQSSLHQVQENRESRARQYALTDYAQLLGWPSDRVLVIDEDQGLSGKTADQRSGFQRLLAEVALDHVGLVLSLEMSRLARSSKDWHHLLEVCAIFGTLLADQDGVYDPSDPNDRLLLGLKGTMSEVELHTMRNRLNRGRLNKAQRGELFYSVPWGYVLLASGEVAFDPDEQVRNVVKLVFEKYAEFGTARSLFIWLLNHDIRIPIRPRRGANKGQIEWRRPSYSSLNQLLHHPMYAGAYAYGRRPENAKHGYPSGSQPPRKMWLPPEKWEVLLRDRLPAYITWDQYLENLERLKQCQTRPDTQGSPRNGTALLNRFVVCGKCGRRMQVSYRPQNCPQYRCHWNSTLETESTCASIVARSLDSLVIEQLFRALEPAGLELSLHAQQDLRRERQQLHRHQQQTLQRARYDIELSERRYRTVDPSNRLVASTLERQWEEALCREREIVEEQARAGRSPRAELSAEDEAQIKALAAEIPSLWNSPHTTNADRQAIIRCLVEQVEVHAELNTDHAEATIHWAGGLKTHHTFDRPVSSYDQFHDSERLLRRITELRQAGHTAQKIADSLNTEGFVPLDRKGRFTQEIVYRLLKRQGIADERTDTSLLKSDEWFLTPLATRLRVPRVTLWYWAKQGWIHSRHTLVQNVVIAWADEDELRRLDRLVQARLPGFNRYPTELITPKSR